MELPNIGVQCSESNCKQLDFLPYKCKCGLTFCNNHFSKHSLTCVVLLNDKEAIPEKTIAEYVCSHPSCSSKSYVPLICEKCKQHFCIIHRHVVACFEKDPDVLAAELERFEAPRKEFNIAKAEIDKKLDETLQQAKQKPKKQQTANKVQLMRVKNKAGGLKSIPTVDRVYFNVQHPPSGNKTESAVFVSRKWSLGRAIDAIAEECRLVNKNNQTNALKLRLFLKSSSEILTTDLTKTLENLLAEQIIIDGDNLIIEYVDNNCVNLNLSQ